MRHRIDTCLVTEQATLRRPRRIAAAASLLLLLAAVLLPGSPAAAAVGPAGPPQAPADSPVARPVGVVIDDYVRLALRANRGLLARGLDVERSAAAFAAARARYLPQLALDARYTRAEGGREVELPIAGLVNPIHGALNDLLTGAGRPAQFPQISDQSFPLIRDREQDTRLTLRQPLYAPAIPAAVRASRASLEASEFARVAAARLLKRDVTVGYLDWLQARRAVDIVEASRQLLAENLRVNESLHRNGRITLDQVLRARAELLAVEQQLREAADTRDRAASYLNFLLARDLDAEPEPAEPAAEIAFTLEDLATLRSRALGSRPELAQAERAVAAAASAIDLAHAARRPTLSLGVDAGTQGERYEFGRGRNFATVSLLLQWNLFDGGARAADLRAARAGERRARTERDELAQQVGLEVQQALDRLETTAASVRTAEARAEAARAAFRIAGRKRDEGVISQVEFIDARSALTSAELNLNLTRFRLLAEQAELDYATAAGSLPMDPGAPLP
jgi:outer membrane protein TolC